jgi:hypothetical protein
MNSWNYDASCMSTSLPVLDLQNFNCLIFFAQIVHGFNNVRHIEIHTAALLIHEPSSFEVMIAVEKLKRYKLSGTNQISEEFIQAGNIHCVLISTNVLTFTVWE